MAETVVSSTDPQAEPSPGSTRMSAALAYSPERIKCTAAAKRRTECSALGTQHAQVPYPRRQGLPPLAATGSYDRSVPHPGFA
jgi:hypothetical protein